MVSVRNSALVSPEGSHLRSVRLLQASIDLTWGLLLLRSSSLDRKVSFDLGCDIILLVGDLLSQELSLGVLVELVERVSLFHSLGVGCDLFQGTESLVIV